MNKRLPALFMILMSVASADAMDLILQDEKSFLIDLAAAVKIQVVDIEPMVIVETDEVRQCGQKVTGRVLDRIYGVMDGEDSTYEFVTTHAGGIRVGSEYLALTKKLGKSAHTELSTPTTDCLRGQGKDILVGVPQSLFPVESILFELTGKKWIRATPRNVVGAREPTLVRLQFHAVGEIQETEVTDSLGNFYWLSYDEFVVYLRRKLGDE